jgi:hypothetical protein
MGIRKLTKTRNSREKMRAAARQPKQATLDNLPSVPQKESVKAVESEPKKQIIITEISTVTKEDELALKIGFKLLPSKTAFSKVKSNLWFDDQQISSVSISIPQSPLASNAFEINPVLDMKGITAGSHTIKVEMHELWASGEKLNYTSKEVTVEYIPKSREDRLIKVPIVKSIAGTGLAVVSDSDKSIYHEIEETMKKELVSRRDEW